MLGARRTHGRALMLVDARALGSGETIAADVCIIGGGAAGITLARELAKVRRGVVLLESGGFEYDEQTQMLYEGSTGDGDPQPEADYLTSSRLRLLGGTTNHWEGWCRPLEPLDLEARPWVPMSGWPIDRAALDPYYARACEHLRIPRMHDDPGDLPPDEELLFPGDGPMQTKLFHQSTALRFGQAYRRELVDSPDIRLYLWANAVALEANEAGTAIERVNVATLAGNGFAVRARFYVLAAGAIEIARLLLSSNRVHEKGIGNDNDMVGRCFMEHPRIEGIGALALVRRTKALATYAVREIDGQRRVWGGLAFTPHVQREHRLLSSCFVFQSHKPPELGPAVAELGVAVNGFAGGDAAGAETPSHARVDIICEQAPNRASRVMLDGEKDAFGHPRARLDWRLADIDRETVRTSLDLFARELGRADVGRAASFVPDDDPCRDVITSGHHIGTARMSHGPKDGVVDATMRVHAVKNLYVASSATFPTSGLASPTPTIVALAVRLADHLDEALG